MEAAMALVAPGLKDRPILEHLKDIGGKTYQ